MSPSYTSISSASLDDVVSDDDDVRPEDDGIQDDSCLSDSGSQSVALSCSVLVYVFSFILLLKQLVHWKVFVRQLHLIICENGGRSICL